MYENGLRITMMSHYWLKPVWYILNWVAHVRKVVSGYLYYLSKAPRSTTPPPICENKGFGLGGSTPNRKVPSWDPEGGFKLIWVRLSFIFPTGLSFSPDQNLYPPVLTAGIEGSNQNAGDGMPTKHTQLCRCAGPERNATTNGELLAP